MYKYKYYYKIMINYVGNHNVTETRSKFSNVSKYSFYTMAIFNGTTTTEQKINKIK